ncbi:hypothetical protein ACU5DF_07665 [Aliivibrio wodanis]|uniref:hypothetical protein n=1 Tax=Aliivibrio wodanis TaxID=80852 RepID=UPI00406CE197
MIYLLDLGVIIRDSIVVCISLPFNWQVSEHDQLGYIASGNSHCELLISPSLKGFAIRMIEVRGE